MVSQNLKEKQEDKHRLEDVLKEIKTIVLKFQVHDEPTKFDRAVINKTKVKFIESFYNPWDEFKGERERFRVF